MFDMNEADHFANRCVGKYAQRPVAGSIMSNPSALGVMMKSRYLMGFVILVRGAVIR